MQAIKAKATFGLKHGALLIAADNSGAKVLKLIAVKGRKTVRGRYIDARIGDYIWASVVRGESEMRGTVVNAIIVRQRMPYKRKSGERIAFESNAAVVVKDELGTPKGTLIKGPIAREVAERWPILAKIAKIIL